MKEHKGKPGKGRGNEKKDPKQLLHEHFGANSVLAEEIWKLSQSSRYPEFKDFRLKNMHLFPEINEYLELRLSLQGIEISDRDRVYALLALFKTIARKVKQGILIPSFGLEVGRETVEIDMEKLWLALHKQIRH